MVAGFCFWERRVLLVCKQKPKWQHGLWNAVGGKAETVEAPVDAMRREFKEETGNYLADWTLFCSELGPDYVVHFFKHQLTVAESNDCKWPLYNDAQEPLSWLTTTDVHVGTPVVGNLRWLVPLAQDWRKMRHNIIVDAFDDIKERPTW